MSAGVRGVSVALRVRPVLDAERARGEDQTCVTVESSTTVCVAVPVGAKPEAEVSLHTFAFDTCLGDKCTQEDVFQKAGVAAMCDAAVDGIAATVMCIGQTGSGKTFTMSGTTVALLPVDPEPAASGAAHGERPPWCDVGRAAPSKSPPISRSARGGPTHPPTPQPSKLAPDAVPSQGDASEDGLQFQAVQRIAERVRRIVEGGERCLMSASYVEVYNERVNDLLSGAENLRCRWATRAQTFFIENLMIVRCDGYDDLLSTLRQGQALRKRAAHNINDDSSRSHVIFTVYVERAGGATPGVTRSEPTRYGKMNFVDLAGSERLRWTESSGVDIKSINKSLHALSNVISALSKNDASMSHIPFRDSVLTKLLMDSLSGNCAVVLLGCVTPVARFAEESIRTIRLVLRGSVNSLKSGNSSVFGRVAAPTQRVNAEERELCELRREVTRLRRENEELKERLEACNRSSEVRALPGTSRSNSPVPTWTTAMRLLTHNFMSCVQCQSFPLEIHCSELASHHTELHAEHLRVLLARIDYAILVEAFESLNATQTEAVQAAFDSFRGSSEATLCDLPSQLEDVNTADDSDDMVRLNFALNALAVKEGKLRCKACTTEYVINDLIPNMILDGK